VIRVKTSLDHKKIRRLIWLVLTVSVLLGYSLQSVAGSVHYSMVMQTYTTVSSPPVFLEEGNVTGASTIYINKTSAKVSAVAPAPTPTYYPNSYNVVTGTYLSGSVPSSVQTVDANYFTVRSAGTSTAAYNPSGYSLLGNTTLVSGATSNLTSNNGGYMTFRSYTNYDFYYNESLGQSDASTTYQDKVTLTFTPPTSGDYIIIADAELAGSSTFYNSLARLYIGTSTYQELVRSIKDTGDWYPFNALKRLSLSAATTMKIQFCSSSGFATASIRNARLIAFKLPSEYAESEGRSTTSNTTWQDKVTLTFTPATAGDYLIIATSNIDGSTSYDVEWRLLQDDTTEHANVVRRPGASAGRYNIGAMRTITLNTTSHSFKIQYCSSSTSGTVGIGYAHVIAIRVDQFPNKYYQESEAEESPAVAGTWYDKVTSTYTPQAGDHLIIGAIQHTSASTSNSVGVRLNQNGSTVTDRLIEQTATTDYESTFSFTKAYLTATSKTDKMQYMGESTATKVKMARILSLQLFEQITEVEFNGNSNTQTWTQLVWTVDSSFTTDSVKTTFQLWNNQTGAYPTSGDGYMEDTIGMTDVTKTQTITTNSTNFRDASGNWKIKIKGVKTATSQFDFKADWIEFKPTYYSDYTVSTEFLFSNMTTNTPTQLNFTVVSQYNVTSVNVTIQVWNYSSSAYVTSGEGYLTYTSSGTNETKLLSINTNPQNYTSNGNAKINITGVKSTTEHYQQELNQIKLEYKYNASSTYDYVLRAVNQVTDNWTVNLQVYDSSNIGRLSSLNVSLHDGTSSNQIAVSGGSIVKSEGEPYNLPGGVNSTVYISMSNLQATATGTSYIYTYLKIQKQNTTTYMLYVITFEIT